MMTASMRRKQKTNYIALGEIVIMQSICIAIIHLMITKVVMNEIGFPGKLYSMMIGGVIALCLLGDVIFAYNRIWLFSKLTHIRAMRCILEDIFFVKYTDEGQAKYKPYLMVRGVENQQLYMTYGKGDLIGFNSTYSYAGNALLSHQIKKENGTVLQIGDYVDLYILRPVKMNVLIEEKNVTLNGKKKPFIHISDATTTDVFQKMNYVQGAIDIDLGI